MAPAVGVDLWATLQADVRSRDSASVRDSSASAPAPLGTRKRELR